MRSGSAVGSYIGGEAIVRSLFSETKSMTKKHMAGKSERLRVGAAPSSEIPFSTGLKNRPIFDGSNHRNQEEDRDGDTDKLHSVIESVRFIVKAGCETGGEKGKNNRRPPS